MFQHIIDTPLGWFKVSGDENHITSSAWINEDEAIVGGSGAYLTWKKLAERQLKEYFEGKRQSFNLPISMEGSTFQRSVWESLSTIPFGQKSNYKDISVLLGDENKARAIGQAIGSNPVLIFIPCHRVIGSDGSLTGYAGGEDRKEWLLKHEGADLPSQLKLF